MKKILTLILGLFVLTMTPPVAYADCSTQGCQIQKGTISSRGEVQKDVSPDTIVIAFEVTTKDKNPQKALSENKRRATAVVNKLSAYVDATKGDSVQTSRFSLNPRYVYLDKKQKLDGYVAKHMITIESHQVSNAGKFIDMAVISGANRVASINYKLKDKDLACQKYLQEAAKKAKMQASLIAEAMGVKIGKIKKINYYCSSDNARPYPLYKRSMMAGANMAEESMPSTPIMPQNIKVKVTINAEFYLED